MLQLTEHCCYQLISFLKMYCETLRHEEIPLAIRLEQLENHLMEMVAVRKGKRVVKQKKNLILSVFFLPNQWQHFFKYHRNHIFFPQFWQVTTLNLYALYQSLWQQEAYFFDVASNFFQELPEIRAYTLKNPAATKIDTRHTDSTSSFL